MASYGKTDIATTGRPLEVIADGNYSGFKAGGVTIDWTTVAAVAGADATLPDGTVVKIGDKYLRFGTVVSIITASGKYGPVNTGAADGRQLMVRGTSFIVNRTMVLSQMGSDHPPVFDRGTVWWDRIVKDGANEPTSANILVAFPGIARIMESP